MNPVDDFLEGFKAQPSSPHVHPVAWDKGEPVVWKIKVCSEAPTIIVAPLTLTPQQRAFLDTRLGASLVVLASDFRQQFNTTAEQTCSLMNQWANS